MEKIKIIKIFKKEVKVYTKQKKKEKEKEKETDVVICVTFFTESSFSEFPLWLIC